MKLHWRAWQAAAKNEARARTDALPTPVLRGRDARAAKEAQKTYTGRGGKPPHSDN